jgi:tRNA acetyltransferase TAN1
MGKRGNSGGKGNKGKRQRCHALIEPGQYGVYATCARHKEMAAAREMRLLLQEAIEKYYPKAEAEAEAEKMKNATEDATIVTSNEASEPKPEVKKTDIEDEIALELAELKKNDDRSKANRNNKSLLLREVPLGVESLTFFQLRQPIIPSDLVLKLCSDLQSSGMKTGRFVQKIVAIDRSGNATAAEFEKMLQASVEKYQEEHPEEVNMFDTYNVNLVKRNFDTISRDEFMEMIQKCFDLKYGPGISQLRYKGARTLVNVYCFKNNIGVSVVPQKSYDTLSKFNVQQLFERTLKEQQEGQEEEQTPKRVNKEENLLPAFEEQKEQSEQSEPSV